MQQPTGQAGKIFFFFDEDNSVYAVEWGDIHISYYVLRLFLKLNWFLTDTFTKNFYS